MSGQSLCLPDSSEMLRFLHLIEQSFDAPNIEKFSECVLSGISGVMRAGSVFLFISDPCLPEAQFTQQGFQRDAGSIIRDRCVEEFGKISSSAGVERLSESIFPAGESFSDLVLYPLRTNGKCVGLIGLAASEGTTPVSPTLFGGALCLLAKAVQSHLERVEHNRQLSYLNTYLTVSSMLAQSLDLHELLESALACCMEVVSADAASVLILDDEKKNFRFYQVEGPAKPLLMSATFPADKGIAGAVLQTQQPEVINDVRCDPRFLGDIDSRSGFRTRNMIVIPLSAGEEKVGVLEVLNKTGGGAFTNEELLVLVSVAEEVAFAIRNAKLFEYVVNTYCLQRQGQMSCRGCKRPLGSWTPCAKYRQASI